MSCCEARATGPGGDVNVTMQNVGGGAEFYVDTTGPNPFEIRTLTSSDSTITVTQNATTINIASNVTLQNEGGFAEFYDTATSTPTTKNIRTLQSSDSSISVTQNATNIDIKVASVPSLKEYYEENSASSTTNNTTYVTLWTTGAITGVVAGEVWELEVSWLICQPPGLTTVNNMTRWQIETGPGTYTDLETNISSCIPISITTGQRSVPHSRIYQFTAAIATPRVRIGMAMSAAVATGAQWEYPRIRAHKKLGT